MATYGEYSSVASATTATADIDLTGLIYYHKISGIVSSDGTLLATFPDTVASRDWVQATSGNRLTYKTNIQNSLPALQATTNTRYMTIATYTRARGSLSAYHVVSYTPAGTQMYALSTQSTGGGISLEPCETSNNIAAFISGNSFVEGPAATAGWQVLTLVLDFTNSRFRIYRNGVSIYTQTSIVNDATTDVVFNLGAPGGAGIGLLGYFGDDALYGVAHNDAAVLANATILKTRWGIA